MTLSRVASIQRAVKRAREEFSAAGPGFAGDLTRQDPAVLNVLRACETSIDPAILANVITRDLDDLLEFSERVARIE